MNYTYKKNSKEKLEIIDYDKNLRIFLLILIILCLFPFIIDEVVIYS